MKFIDTNFLIDVLKPSFNQLEIISELDSTGPHAINTIVQFEFLFGGYNSQRKDEVDRRKDVLKKFLILPIDEETADIAAKMASKLRLQGNTIGNADCLIAASMKANQIDTIVTRNVKHFELIEGINIEIW